MSSDQPASKPGGAEPNPIPAPLEAHVPVVTELATTEWGVYCAACSAAAGDYVRRCRVRPDDWPPLVLRPALTADDRIPSILALLCGLDIEVNDERAAVGIDRDRLRQWLTGLGWRRTLDSRAAALEWWRPKGADPSEEMVLPLAPDDEGYDRRTLRLIREAAERADITVLSALLHLHAPDHPEGT